MTKGFLPCDDGLVKATKLNKGLPNPSKRHGVAAGLPGSCERHVQSSGSLPPAAPQVYRLCLCRSMLIHEFGLSATARSAISISRFTIADHIRRD